ncbi:hypothetical protein BLNAU_1623 [Blattamonas nauphoetae]|uniref:Uncharacterized protein n=1 Tax=Blattamonas nauphoetae TaxID=2049346 RepID=A0ABQ9YIJ4_9EUKA|nr:hypothetical protein BLNAU_1623 [Blattamonas nauphoetae]
MRSCISTSSVLDEHSNDGMSSVRLSLSTDNSAFMNWDGRQIETMSDRSTVLRSLVAKIKDGHHIDDASEKKAVMLLDQIRPFGSVNVKAFVRGLIVSEPNNYLTDFVISITVLVSSSKQTIIKGTMLLLEHLFSSSSPTFKLKLIEAQMIPQIITSLNAQSLFVAKAEDIHTPLIRIVNQSLRLITPHGMKSLEIEHQHDQQKVHETVLHQFLVPLEEYLRNCCKRRFSFLAGSQSFGFVVLIQNLLDIYPYYLPTMDFVLSLPVVLTIPSCLTFLENEFIIRYILIHTFDIPEEWNKQTKNPRQAGMKLLLSLRMEGFDDATEQQLQSDKGEYFGSDVVDYSIKLNNLQGNNIGQLE